MEKVKLDRSGLNGITDTIYHLVDSCVEHHSDFPKEGCRFIDLTPLLADVERFRVVISLVCIYLNHHRGGMIGEFDSVTCMDSQGFIIGTAIAKELNLPIYLARKKGKLPPPTVSVGYSMEYGVDEVEMKESDIEDINNTLIVDDAISTGGTIAAVESLLGDKCSGSFTLVDVSSVGKLCKTRNISPIKMYLDTRK